MNNKLLFVVLVLCGLILSSLIIRDGKLLLLAMPFLIYLIIGFIQAPTDVKLTASRFIDKPGIIDQGSFEMRITIKNQGNALVNLFLADSLFPSMTILDGEAHQRLSLQTGETTELKYIAKAKRGVYEWNTIRVCASDPFGIFELESDISAPGEILVRPAPIKIRRIPLRPRTTLHATGPIPARLAGPGIDFWGVREYRAGDSLRRLNWRLATRHPRKLFTNEYEREEIADFGLILDTRKISNDDAMEETLFEHSVSVVATLSETFLKNGNRVALLTFGETVTSLFPGYGKRQLNSILRALSRVKLGTNLPLGYLEYFPARLFPSRSQIVILSSVDSRDLETYARLRAYGYEVLLISPNPVDFSARKLPTTEINSLAIRAARIERVIMLQRLLKLGIEVIDWQVNESFEMAMNKVTEQWIHRRNILAGD